MLLSVVRNDSGYSRLGFEDLPLGPWARRQLQVWASKTGLRWHGDESCSALRTRAREEVYLQPESGALADRRLPEGIHCDPRGDLGDYMSAAKDLVRYAAATDRAHQQLEDGDVPLDVLPYADRWSRPRQKDLELEFTALADVWAAEQSRRERVVDRCKQELDPRDARLAHMSLASWIRAGRTPRQHQERYDRFIIIAAEELERRDLSSLAGEAHYVNTDRLPNWLDAIIAGRSFNNATRSLVERELAHHKNWPAATYPDLECKIEEAWAAAATRWQGTIEAMAYAHPGIVLAIFHRYGGTLDYSLRDACVDFGPSAVLNAGQINWVVGLAPAAWHLHLREKDRGLVGLVLLDENLHQITNETCERFLRNLVRSLGHPDLAEYVQAGDATTDDDPRDPADFALVWPHDGFTSEHRLGAGITISQCMPALRAALDGRDLQPDRKSSQRTSRTRRRP